MIPLLIDLKNESVLIAGGGGVAKRRLELLLAEEASITLVSPEIDSDIKEWISQERLTWLPRKIEEKDLSGYRLIVAATNDSEVNRWISETAGKHTLVNVVSKASEGNVQVPKILKKGRLTISISTGGASPKVSKELGNKIMQLLDDDLAEKLDLLWDERNNRK
ncbi:precorrin-2 dehydrogenase/sirohydrochlorin ferrochelatase family protein [Metabacillus sp. RGM 3146]|uniref:precorrin-2 dehydrogenase/sirohydrochlorin ferrochelatase family protein n=1 Tax=Metabacillus sp. RGM 3146 TaxID=3401092 RepID=UPI003B9DBA99